MGPTTTTTTTTSSSSRALVNQALAAMIRGRQFDADLGAAVGNTWTSDAVSQVLRSVPKFLLFLNTPRQRHRTPLKQRDLRQESDLLRVGSPVVDPAGYLRDPKRIHFGLTKSTEFFKWVEWDTGFTHDQVTIREMAIVFAKANKVRRLWNFLKIMSYRGDGFVTTESITCLIKCLGEEGLVNEAAHLFQKMSTFRCKPNVDAYNTIIYALCSVGFNVKAKTMLLRQMELPGFRCPPDTSTYNILISSCCINSTQTRCSKAIRRRMWEANYLFRRMLFNGIAPDVVTYNALIDACCKTNRVERALELFEDMNKRGCAPTLVTYDSFIRYYCAVDKIEWAIEMLRKMQQKRHGIPSVSSYTPIIHAFCQRGNAVDSLRFMLELLRGGFIPRECSYKLVCHVLHSQGKAAMLDDKTRREIEDGISARYQKRRIVKSVMRRNNSDL